MTPISATRHLGCIVDPSVDDLYEGLKADEVPRHFLNGDAPRGEGRWTCLSYRPKCSQFTGDASILPAEPLLVQLREPCRITDCYQRTVYFLPQRTACRHSDAVILEFENGPHRVNRVSRHVSNLV